MSLNEPTQEHIAVAVRMRPINSRESNQGDRDCWKCNPDLNCLHQVDENNSAIANSIYTYDCVYGPESTTNDVYVGVGKQIIDSFMKGINGTIFAYGQTSSGKTYTMHGNEISPGLLYLASKDIFDYMANTPTREFILRGSYVEIYKEEVKDLLNPSSQNLKIRESYERGVYVESREELIRDYHDLLALLQIGEKNRHVGETNMNQQSSRSHTIFRMICESRVRPDDQDNTSEPSGVLVGQLSLVDLAGSESVKYTGAKGETLDEARKINLSLSVLSRVISALATKATENSHVSYRDSKLTRILQSSLDGNARTAIIACVTPASSFCIETISTLKFAQRAKNVNTSAKVNELLDDKAIIRKLRRELEILKKQGQSNPLLANQNIIPAETQFYQNDESRGQKDRELSEAHTRLEDLSRDVRDKDLLLQQRNIEKSSIETELVLVQAREYDLQAKLSEVLMKLEIVHHQLYETQSDLTNLTQKRNDEMIIHQQIQQKFEKKKRDDLELVIESMRFSSIHYESSSLLTVNDTMLTVDISERDDGDGDGDGDDDGLRQVIQRLFNQLDQLQKENETLNQQLETVQGKHQQSQSQLSDLTQEMEKTEIERQKLFCELSVLPEMKQLQSDHDKLQRELCRMEKERERLMREKEDEKEELKTVQKEYEKEKEKNIEIEERRLQSLAASSHMELLARESLEGLEVMKEKMEKERKKREEVEKERKEEEKKREMIMEEVKEERKKRKEVEKMNEEINEEMKKYMKQEQIEQIEQIEQNRISNQLLNELKSSVNILQNELKITKLNSDLREKELLSINHALKTQSILLENKEKGMIKQHLEKLQTNQQISDIREKDLQKRIMISDRLIDSQQHQLQETQSLLHSNDQLFTQLQVELHTLKHVIQSSDEELDSLESIQAMDRDDINTLTQQIRRLRREKVDAEAEAHRVIGMLEGLRGSCADGYREAEMLQKELNESEGLLAIAKDANQRALAQIAELQREKETFQITLQGAEERITQAEERATVAEERIIQAEERTTVAEERVAQAETMISISEERTTLTGDRRKHPIRNKETKNEKIGLIEGTSIMSESFETPSFSQSSSPSPLPHRSLINQTSSSSSPSTLLHLRNELKESQERYMRLQQTMQSKYAEFIDMKEKVTIRDSELLKVQDYSEKLERYNERMKTALAEAKTKYDKIRNKNKELQNACLSPKQLEAARNTIEKYKKLLEKAKELESEKNRVSGEMLHVKNEKIIMEEKLELSQKQSRNHVVRIEELEGELKDLQNNTVTGSYGSSRAFLEQENLRLSVKVDEMKQRLDDIQRKSGKRSIRESMDVSTVSMSQRRSGKRSEDKGGGIQSPAKQNKVSDFGLDDESQCQTQ